MSTIPEIPDVSATAPFEVTDDPREALLRNGYAFMPGLLDPDAVLALRAELMGFAGEAGWLAPGSDPVEALPGGRVINEATAPEEYAAVYRRVQGSRRFHALGNDPALLGVAERILGEPIFPLPSKIARFRFPTNEDSKTPPHQDYGYIHGSADTLIAWLPLGDCPAGTGRLIALAGSHLLGLQHAYDAWRADTERQLEWHGGDYKAGDVLFFHCLTIHAAERNHSTRVRVSTDFRFQPVADPVNPQQLEPHYEPAPWEELYEGWPAGSGQWYWRDLPLRTRVRADELEEAQARARDSRLFAR